MSKFRFRLATLLRIREVARDQCRLELAEVERADAKLQNQLAQISREQTQLQCERREAAGPGTVDIPLLVEAHRYASALQSQAADLRQQRETLATEIDRCRQALIEVDREVRTLEKLREKQLQAYRQEEDRQESKRLDEAALQTVGPGRSTEE